MLLNHSLVLKAVAHHTNLRGILLYVERWLKAPLQLEDGTLRQRDRGSPQGSAISPVPVSPVDAEARERRPLPAAGTGRRAVTPTRCEDSPMSTVTRRALTAWLVDHGFAELGGKATSHRRFRHESGVVITVPGHGRQNLSQKHVGMIVRQLEGFDRDAVRRDLKAR